MIVQDILSVIPLWLVLALLAVVGKTLYYILQKRLLDDDESSLKLGYISSVYGMILLAPVGIFQFVRTDASVSFVVLVIVGLAVLEIFGLLVYLEALSETEISIASPIKKMSPVGVAILEPVLLGVDFNIFLVIGASFTGIGAFVVLSDDLDVSSLLHQFKSRGPKLAVLAMGAYVFLSLGSRFGNVAFGPFIYGTIVFTVMSVGYYLLLLQSNVTTPSLYNVFSQKYAIMGVTGVLRSVFVWGAYALAAATIITSVTKLTILLDVIIGGQLFNEENLLQKSIGSIMILSGVLVVILV